MPEVRELVGESPGRWNLSVWLRTVCSFHEAASLPSTVWASSRIRASFPTSDKELLSSTGDLLFSFPDSFSTTAWPVAAQRKHGGLEITMVAWKFFTPRGFPWAGHFVAVYTFRRVSLN